MVNINDVDYGLTPPQAIELEEAILGVVLTEERELDKVIGFLKPEHFYKSVHRVIFTAILDLFEVRSGIDILTVSEKLRQKRQLDEVGGQYFITQLSGKVSSSIHLEEYGQLVYQAFIQRELITIGNELVRSSHDESVNPYELIDETTIGLMKLNENTSGDSVPVRDAILEEMDNIESKYKGEKVDGIKTKLVDLDYMLGFLEPTLIILAARPSMGKSSLAVQIANNVSVEQKIPGAIFSLEMTRHMLTRWLTSQVTGIGNSKIKSGDLTEEEFGMVNKTMYQIAEAPLYIDDGSGYNIMSLRSRAIKLKHRYDIQYMIVDYLQLVSGLDKKGKVTNRENEVSEISRGLKGISKELNIPVIALSQLNRKLMDRRDKVPVLSDLRESGSVEQDADIVIFIHRPEKYGIDSMESESGIVNSKNLAQLLIAKHRDGATGSVLTRFYEETVSFKNMGSGFAEKEAPF